MQNNHSEAVFDEKKAKQNKMRKTANKKNTIRKV